MYSFKYITFRRGEQHHRGNQMGRTGYDDNSSYKGNAEGIQEEGLPF